MIVGLLRHGRTAWNDSGRLQGRADVPLSAAGRAQVARWRLPAELAGARVVASPLARAVQTARLLANREPAIDADLTELDWGAWEGETFAGLRERHAAAFAAAEACGLDFRPPAGESMREVQRRLLRWLDRLPSGRDPVLAVTHKGVLNALVAHLTGWNTIGTPPVKLRPDSVHLLHLDAQARIVAQRWSVSLLPA